MFVGRDEDAGLFVRAVWAVVEREQVASDVSLE